MCGIAGLWDEVGAMSRDARNDVIRRMTMTLAKRGPDDQGYFDEPDDGLSLGHRRLSILDLSPFGHQPMVSPSGRYVIVFNGEIYNHKRLRPELESVGFRFRGNSDTEVMLAAIEHWGPEQAAVRFIGMFSLALWDRKRHELTLGRDRLGIKPLYYGWVGGRFVFGSELKALRAVPDFSNQINRDALKMLLKHNYIAAPNSIYENIYKLMPATLLTLDAQAARAPLAAEALSERLVTYWSLQSAGRHEAAGSAPMSAEDAIDGLEALLRDATALHMEADVPLGGFLSGGVDSSTVCALMQSQSRRPVKTFTVGFHEFGFDEASHARAVARHLGTDHTELYVTAADALRVIPSLSRIYDEPFADSSQIPTFLVSELTRRHVTVSLSGDGGDELFAGYDRYFWARRIWDKTKWIPNIARNPLALALRAAPGAWAVALKGLSALSPGRRRMKNPREKIKRFADLIVLNSSDELYVELISHALDSEAIVVGGKNGPGVLIDTARLAKSDNFTERMMYIDIVSYLPDDILAKIDRASMAVSLEARVPLLDHRVVEFAWRLPMDLKIRGGVGKWILRQVLLRHLPRELIERPKQGFGIPVSEWLRGPLRDWAESLLGERRLIEGGFLSSELVRKLWLDHIDSRADNGRSLWGVLMFQAWLDTQ